MKYTIFGFNQKKAVELGLDTNDLLIIRWFVDFYSSQKMVKINMGDKTFAWVSYSKIIEDIPILNMKKDMVYKRLKKICDTGIMEHETMKKGGTFSLYRLTDKYDELICYEEHSEKNQDSTEKNSEGYGKNSLEGTEKIQDQNINLLKEDNSININSKKERKTNYNAIIDEMVYDADIKDLLLEHIKMRVMKKKPVTDKALRMLINKLYSLSSDIEEQKKIIEQSIINCWDSFYQLKKEVKNNGNAKRYTASIDYDQFIDN